MMKISINTIVGAVIVYRLAGPSNIFIDMKDAGHPVPLARGQLCPQGGNWIGSEAKMDQSPKFTLIRELGEELTLRRRNHHQHGAHEALLLGHLITEGTHHNATPINNIEVTEADELALELLKHTIVSSLKPFGDYLETVSLEALTLADPNNKRPAFTTLVSYYTAGLFNEDWVNLLRLQEKFGNLSAESISVVTSLDEIIKNGTKTMFGHDRVLKQFFLDHGYSRAKEYPLVENITTTYAGQSLPSYSDYLEIYDVLRKP